MKRVLLLVIMLSVCNVARTQQMVSFRFSRPFALLTFMRAAAKDAHVSSTLSSYILAGISPADSAGFFSNVRQFKRIPLGGSFTYPDYPTARQKPRSVEELVNIAAIQSQSTAAFFERIVGVLPNEDLQSLRKCINNAELFYDRLMSPHENALRVQLQALRKYSKRTDIIFNKLKQFYGSTWSNEMPFTVSLYPIPGRTGNTTASPYSNSLALAVLTEEEDHDMRMGVAIHEICHMLYQEQPLKKQWSIDAIFSHNRSRYARYAYNYFDEALATACGNGWSYKQLHGSIDTGDWYADKHINGFGKALYPMVENYINADKQIDSVFIERAIETFSKTFPQAPFEFENLLNSVNIYTDAAEHSVYSEIFADVARNFRLTNANGSYPISDPQALQQMKTADGTILCIVHTDHLANYKVLGGVFPEVKDAEASKEGIAMFFDAANRPVILINVSNRSKIEKAILMLQQQRVMRDGFSFLELH